VIDGRCILVCRKCGSGDLPMPFESYKERGKWAAAHTRGTGHERWVCLDGWPSPELIKKALAPK
jgi:hypothetical protein